MDMMKGDDGNMDIPEGMDPDDARAAIKLLYGVDQTYRSVLRDFANYEKTKTLLQGGSKKKERIINVLENNKKDSAAAGSTRRKRLRRSKNNNNNNNERNGRITHLHVTGIASMFLPSWDLSFADVVKLDCLVSLKLNGCDSVPSEVFFELPHLKSLWLINCQELTDPAFSIASHRMSKKSRSSSAIEQLDIRGGGLWGHEFLSTLRLLLPWMSSTLKTLKLSHTPYTSCYNNTYMTSIESIHNTDGAIEETEDVSERLRIQRIEDGLLQQTLFHESMGKLMLDAMLSLARGMSQEDSNDEEGGFSFASSSSPLEYLSLSFFNSLLDRDVSSLMLDVIPEFSHLVTLHLPHHTISNLKIASRRISDQQQEFRLQPDKVLSSPPHILRSSFSSTQRQTSVASVSRLRRLWLKPTMKHRASDEDDSRSGSNRDDKDILVSLLTHFSELSCVARSSNHKGYMYSPCPCCCGCSSGSGSCCGNGQDKRPAEHCNSASERTNQAIEYLLRMNHSGRCLLEGLDSKVQEDRHRHRYHHHHKRQCPLSVWPLVLERAWKVPPPDFCGSSSKTSDTVSILNANANASAGVIFRLLRDGPILSNRIFP
jgi:hypothetical protein